MTNIEYYGFKNLEYKTINDGLGVFICEIYYKPKHSKEKILLKKFKNTERGLVRDKTKWLLHEPKFPMNIYGSVYFNYIEDLIAIELYIMRHSRRL